MLLNFAQDVIHFRQTKGDRPFDQTMNEKSRRAARGLLAFGWDPLVGVGPARFRQWVHEAERDAGLDRVWPHLLGHAFSNTVAKEGDVEGWRRSMTHATLSEWPRCNVADEDRVRGSQREV